MAQKIERMAQTKTRARSQAAQSPWKTKDIGSARSAKLRSITDQETTSALRNATAGSPAGRFRSIAATTAACARQATTRTAKSGIHLIRRSTTLFHLNGA